jgi:hypothetical protein
MRIKSFTLILMLVGSVSFALEIPLAWESLTRKSDRIARGSVRNLSCKAGTNEFGDELIYTDVYIGVTDALKGDRSDFVLTIEGGTLDDVTLTVSDAPVFKIGEEVVVFAVKDTLTYRPVAGTISKYTISEGNRIREAGMDYSTFKNGILHTIRGTEVRK